MSSETSPATMSTLSLLLLLLLLLPFHLQRACLPEET
jgi:hypothetical protein